MNDACEVVGSVGPGYENQDPYHWKNGEMFFLPTVGKEITYAVGINNSGLIIGTALDPKDSAICGIVWKDGKIIDTGRSVAKHENHFISINDRGDIVGYDRINGKSQAFIYSGKSVEYIPSNLDCTPQHINNHGQIVGYVFSDDHRKTTAFLFVDKKFHELGTLGGVRSHARCVNDSMVVVGESYFGSGVDLHAFVWKTER